MSYNVIPTDNFGKKLKELKKKYPLIIDDIRNFRQNINEFIRLGKPLGKDCYKVRMQITGKNTGKSGGARIIMQVKITEQNVYLLTIYDKSDQDTVKDNEIDRLIALI